MEKQYAETPLHLCSCMLSEDTARFPYIQGKTLHERFLSLLEQDDSSKLLSFIKEYIKLIIAGEKVPFSKSSEFVDLFGDISLPDGLVSLRYTNIDMMFENLIVSEDDTISLIDYEWCFSFPIPINYTIFRSLINSFEKACETERLYSEILPAVGIQEQEIALYQCMEHTFRNVVYANAYPIDWYYSALGQARIYPAKEHEELLRTREELKNTRYELQNTQSELNEIKSSRSWKLVIYLRKIKGIFYR